MLSAPLLGRTLSLHFLYPMETSQKYNLIYGKTIELTTMHSHNRDLLLLVFQQKEAEALIQLLKEFPTAKAWLSLACKARQASCAATVTLVKSYKCCNILRPAC